MRLEGDLGAHWLHFLNSESENYKERKQKQLGEVRGEQMVRMDNL